MDNKHNSLNLAAKICSDICPWTLSVPRSSQLSENCSLLGTDNVCGQISEHIFAPNEGYYLFIEDQKHEYWFIIAHVSFLFLTWLLHFMNLYIEDASWCYNCNSLLPLCFKMPATNRRPRCCEEETSVIACPWWPEYLLYITFKKNGWGGSNTAPSLYNPDKQELGGSSYEHVNQSQQNVY